MLRMRIGTLLAALLAFPGVALAGSTTSPAASAAFDPDRAWQQFLASGEFIPAYRAFDVMEAVGYDGDRVDPDKCRQQVTAIRKAVAAAPVSIAVRRVAFLCAEAGNDEAATDREMEAFAALARHALAQAGDSEVTAPIRVLAPVDAIALVLASGMQVHYLYYTQIRPTRYFPVVVVGWDPQAKVERHLTFDFIDTDYRIDKQNRFWGSPFLRSALAEGLVDEWAKEQDASAARDIQAAREAATTDDVQDKLAKLRPAAQAGGIQSAAAWLLLCTRVSSPDCGEGVVDALLPRAEQQQAMPMLLLAYAYAKGIGVARDEASAWSLVDAAERRWPRGAATVELARLWLLGNDAIPPALQQRLERAGSQGNRYPQRLAIRNKIKAGGDNRLSEAELAFLAEPAENGNGAGYALLADYYDRPQQQQQRLPWLEKAALAGDALSQAYYASALIYGTDVAIDATRGQSILLDAAHGGIPWAMRHESTRLGELGKWEMAEAWLLPAAYAGDIDTLLDLAGLYEDERPGVSGKADRAVQIYRALADGNDSAAARRRLADMAIDGRGMKKDPKQAEQWLRVDAEKGDHRSETRLGLAYLRGDLGAADHAEGKRWIERAVAGKEEWAYSAYGAWLYHNEGTPAGRARAFELWEQSHAAGFKRADNELAWASCTSPFPDSFNPKRGMDTVARMGDPLQLDLAQLDTVAACYAAGGDFKRAVELQSQAVERIAALARRAPDEFKSDAGGFRARLALYRAGKRYVDSERD
jgi:TPR repeat protein